MEDDISWIKESPAAVTICDTNGVILQMNRRASETFAKDGGAALMGKNLYDCHPEPARSKLRQIMINQGTNCYTIEKDGKRKMIYQSPWYKEGVFGGLVEISFEIPHPLPHFVRK